MADAFMIVSLWTRGGNVFTEHADHTSQIKFVESWLEALGFGDVKSNEIPTRRRQHMSNRMNAFDFDNPDFLSPTVASAPASLTTPGPEPSDGIIGALSGNSMGAAKCLDDDPSPHPPVPYGAANAVQNMTLATEQEFKKVRGALTEGCFLTLEAAGLALRNSNGMISFSVATAKHDDIHRRWILHQQGVGGSNVFTVSSALDGLHISSALRLVDDRTQTQPFTIADLGNGRGYSICHGGKSPNL